MNMQKTLAGMLGLIVALTATASADVYTGNMVANPYMSDNYDDWAPVAPWRSNGAVNDNMVYDFRTDGPTGWFPTVAATRDLTADAAITGDADYNASTTKLTGLSFGNSWVSVAGLPNAGAALDARYYCRIEVATVGGDQYQVDSDQKTFDSSWASDGVQSWTMGSWLDNATYSGNPFAGDDGIALDQIASIDYSWFMYTITTNTDGGGTTWFTADNANLQYEVTTIPEPATLGIVVAFGGGLLWIRRKFMI